MFPLDDVTLMKGIPRKQEDMLSHIVSSLPILVPPKVPLPPLNCIFVLSQVAKLGNILNETVIVDCYDPPTSLYDLETGMGVG